MPVPKQQQLNVYEFGRQLIDTKDLDPVYVLLWQAQLDREVLFHWLLAYFCFYHVGTASWITEQGSNSEEHYWAAMSVAAGSKEYPRSSERRHFRGNAAINAVTSLESVGVVDLFEPLLEPRTYQLEEVTKYIKTWRNFGPWISFKVADMLERLEIVEVEFDEGAMFMFDSPRKGADMLWKTEGHPSMGEGNGETGQWAVRRILNELGDLYAPPIYDRRINCQEAETILCKHHSYIKGHYHLGEDIHSCKQGLMKFSKCKLSQKLIAGGRSGGLW